MKLQLLCCAMVAMVLPMSVSGQDAAVAEKATDAKAKADSVDGIATEIMTKLQELPLILGGVKDDATADDAVKKIGTVGGDLKEIATRLEKLDMPSDEDRVKISKRFEEQMKDSSGKMQGVMIALAQKPELMGKINTAMQKFSMDMQDSGKVFQKYFEPKKVEEKAPEKE